MSAYAAAIERLFRARGGLGMKFSLRNAQSFAEELQLPHRAYPCIHVAGSNGKGSVCHKIAAALQAGGYRVGLYTSPHLLSFCERIVVNGQMIDEGSVALGLQTLFAIDDRLELKATFFELTTLLAFDHFRNQQVDVAVIETGLGGRLDATNIIDPILTVITSISREHVSMLGDDLETIASEKAGILKPGIPCVLGPKAIQESIQSRARALGCPLIFAKSESPFFDDQNSAIAQNALEVLKPRFSVCSNSVKSRPACRFEKRGSILYDVAHNPDAFEHLVKALEAYYPSVKKRFLIGLCKDKEMGECLKKIIPIASHIHLVQAETGRAASPQELAECLQGLGVSFYSCHATISEGIDEGKLRAESAQELLIVCGSFYIMNDILRRSEFKKGGPLFFAGSL